MYNATTLNILTNILSEIIIFITVTVYFFVTNHVLLFKKLGFTRVQLDIPYDKEANLVLIAKVNNVDKEGAYVFPQTSKTDYGWSEASMVNGEELGLLRHQYCPKKFLGLVNSSRFSRKIYELAYVKVSKACIEEAINDKTIPWKKSDDGSYYRIVGVEYIEAKFAKPSEALKIAQDGCVNGTLQNPTRAKTYKMSLDKLAVVFPNLLG